MACILFAVSAVNVQDSQAYRNMDMTRERISLIFELSAIFLSFQMVLSLASAAVAWAILARISGLDPSSVMIAPRYLNRLTQSSFSPLTLMSVLKPLVLLVVCLGPIVRHLERSGAGGGGVPPVEFHRWNSTGQVSPSGG